MKAKKARLTPCNDLAPAPGSFRVVSLPGPIETAHWGCPDEDCSGFNTVFDAEISDTGEVARQQTCTRCGMPYQLNLDRWADCLSAYRKGTPLKLLDET